MRAAPICVKAQLINQLGPQAHSARGQAGGPSRAVDTGSALTVKDLPAALYRAVTTVFAVGVAKVVQDRPSPLVRGADVHICRHIPAGGR